MINVRLKTNQCSSSKEDSWPPPPVLPPFCARCFVLLILLSYLCFCFLTKSSCCYLNLLKRTFTLESTSLASFFLSSSRSSVNLDLFVVDSAKRLVLLVLNILRMLELFECFCPWHSSYIFTIS